jgi:hypothetical protein
MIFEGAFKNYEPLNIVIMKIKTFIPLFTLLPILLVSCKKSATGPGSPAPGPVGPPGSSSGITVTGISPLNPYPGDVITITGTGFDADKTKDTVRLGTYDSTVTQSDGSHFYVSRVNTTPSSKVISASSTQIQFVNDSTGLNLPATFKFAVRVSSPQKSGYTENLISFKDPVSFLYQWQDPNPSFGCINSTFPGDSMLLTHCKGLYPPIIVTIGGKPTNIAADGNNSSTARGYMPFNFFGLNSPNKCDSIPYLPVKVTNADGRSFTYSRFFAPSPNSFLNSPFSLNLSYSVSQTSTAVIPLTGYALRDDYYMIFYALDNNNGKTFSEELILTISAGYPNQGSLTIDLTSFPKPSSAAGTTVNYKLKAGASSNYDGFATTAFTLYP